MKRLVALLLLFPILFTLCGGWLVFQVRLGQQREAMRIRINQGIPRALLTIISCPAGDEDNLRWENGHEFRKDGAMYDVVSSEILADGTVLYYCINDHEESQLSARIHELDGDLKSAERSSRSYAGAFMKLLSGLYLNHLQPVPAALVTLASGSLPRVEVPASSGHFRVPVPPPEHA